MKLSRKSYTAGVASALALGLMLSVLPGVHAQQTVATDLSGQKTAGAATVRQAVNQFADKYGTPIIQRGAIDSSAYTSLSLAADGSARTREADIARLADAAGAGWHRMFFIAPAASGKPVTTLAGAQALTTDSSTVSLQIKGKPLEAAARAFAAASGSEVTLTGDAAEVASTDVTIPAANLTAAQVIARMAAQTKTHWTVGYVLQPLPPGSARLARRSQDSGSNAVPVTSAATSDQGTATGSSSVTGSLSGYSPTPPMQNDLNGNPYAQTATAIPDGYDQNGNPYYYVGDQAGNGGQSQGYAQNPSGQPYAMNGGYPAGYSDYYGYPAYNGGFTTTSPTYYGYGYPGMDPYSAGVTQQYNYSPGASALPGGPESSFGVAPEFGTVFSTGSSLGGGSTTLTP